MQNQILFSSKLFIFGINRNFIVIFLSTMVCQTYLTIQVYPAKGLGHVPEKKILLLYFLHDKDDLYFYKSDTSPTNLYPYT